MRLVTFSHCLPIYFNNIEISCLRRVTFSHCLPDFQFFCPVLLPDAIFCRRYGNVSIRLDVTHICKSTKPKINRIFQISHRPYSINVLPLNYTKLYHDTNQTCQKSLDRFMASVSKSQKCCMVPVYECAGTGWNGLERAGTGWKVPERAIRNLQVIW